MLLFWGGIILFAFLFIITMRVEASAFDNLIADASLRFGVEVALIKAIIKTESSFNPHALNVENPDIAGDDSFGLMQIGLQVAQDAGLVKDWHNPTATEIADLFEAKINIDTGTAHLAKLLRKYALMEAVIQMYNIGETAYNEGKRSTAYLLKVLGFYNVYK